MVPANSMPPATQAVQTQQAASAMPVQASSLLLGLGTMRANGQDTRSGPPVQAKQEDATGYAKLWAQTPGNPYAAMTWTAAAGTIAPSHMQMQQQTMAQFVSQPRHTPPPDLVDVGPLLQLHASIPSPPPSMARRASDLNARDLYDRVVDLEGQLRSVRAQNASLMAQVCNAILKPSVRSIATQTTDPAHATAEMSDEATEEESKQISPSPVPPAAASSVEPDTAAILAAVESLMAKPAPVPPRAELMMPLMPMPQPSSHVQLVPSPAAASFALPAVVVAAASSSASLLDNPPRSTLNRAPLYSPVVAAASPADSGGDEEEELEEHENEEEPEPEQEQDEEGEEHDDAPEDVAPEPKPKRVTASKPKAKTAAGSGSGKAGVGANAVAVPKKNVVHPFPSTARRSSDRFQCPFVNCANSFALCSRRTIKRHVIECAYKDPKVGPLLRAQRFGDEQNEYDAVKHLLLTVKRFAPKELKGFIFRQHKEKRDKHDTPYANRWYCPNQNRGCDEFFVSTSSTSKAKHLASCPFESRPITLTAQALEKLRAALRAVADGRAEAYRDRQQQHNLAADGEDAEADAMDTGSPPASATKAKRKPWALNSPRRDGFVEPEAGLGAATDSAATLASMPAASNKRRAAALSASQRRAAAHLLESDSDGTDDDAPPANQRAESRLSARAAPAAAAAAPSSAGKPPANKRAKSNTTPVAPATSADYAALIQQAAQASRQATGAADRAT